MTEATPANRARQAAGMTPSTSSGKEVSTLQEQRDKRIKVVESLMPTFRQALMGDTQLAQRLIADGSTALRATPGLVKATQESFLGALMTAAQLNLRPNTVLGHGWILPYEDKRKQITVANWQIGYKGIVELGARSGVTIIARTAFEGDEFKVSYGLNEDLVHVPDPHPDLSKPRVPIAHYAIARSATGTVWTHMWHEEALAAREQSMAYKFSKDPSTPWRAHELPMCRKTVVRRLAPFIRTQSPELAMGIVSDDKIRTDLNPEPEVFDNMTRESVDLAQPREDYTQADVVIPEPDKPAETKPEAASTESLAVLEQGDPGDRPAQKVSKTRAAMVDALVDKHGMRTREALTRSLGGQEVPLSYLSVKEIRAALALDLTPEGDAPADELEGKQPDAGRASQPNSAIRSGLIKRLTQHHPDTWQTALDLVIGERVDPSTVTDDELMAALKIPVEQAQERQLDEAAAAEGH